MRFDRGFAYALFPAWVPGSAARPPNRELARCRSLMRRDRGTHAFRMASVAIAVLGCLLGASPSHAQDIEPRQYANTPVGVNFFISGYAHTQGGLSFDPSLPISNPDLQTNSSVFGFARSLDFWGHSGKVDVIVPYTWLSGSAELSGVPVTRQVDGPADPRFRVSVNLYGAPSLTLKELPSYRQDLIVGAALQVSAPWGQYDPARAVNIGSNRWFFKPSLGVSQAVGPWILEATAAITVFTDNTDFFGGKTREQDALYAMETHLIRSFARGIWGSLDATFFTGGQSTVNGVAQPDRQRNWRVGATLAIPLNARNSLKLYASNGVSSRTGNDFDLLGVAWQYRFGGGI